MSLGGAASHRSAQEPSFVYRSHPDGTCSRAEADGSPPLTVCIPQTLRWPWFGGGDPLSTPSPRRKNSSSPERFFQIGRALHSAALFGWVEGEDKVKGDERSTALRTKNLRRLIPRGQAAFEVEILTRFPVFSPVALDLGRGGCRTCSRRVLKAISWAERKTTI